MPLTRSLVSVVCLLGSNLANQNLALPALNAWTHVCGMFDWAGGLALFYQNSAKYSSTFIGGSTPAGAGGQPVQIGYGELGFSQVDCANVQVYSQILTTAEVTTLYQNGIGASFIPNRGVVGWWPLSGSANDFSGNGNHGTNSATGVTYLSQAAFTQADVAGMCPTPVMAGAITAAVSSLTTRVGNVEMLAGNTPIVSTLTGVTAQKSAVWFNVYSASTTAPGKRLVAKWFSATRQYKFWSAMQSRGAATGTISVTRLCLTLVFLCCLCLFPPGSTTANLLTRCGALVRGTDQSTRRNGSQRCPLCLDCRPARQRHS